jgi:hypothetical protein
MIRAEYNNLKQLIELCDEAARRHKTGVPDSPGLYLLTRIKRLGGLSPIEAWNLVFNYVVPSNADQMIALLDDRCLNFVERSLSPYPQNDDGWRKLEEEYYDPEHHPENVVPYRTPSELVERDRIIVTIIRSAMARRQAK